MQVAGVWSLPFAAAVLLQKGKLEENKWEGRVWGPGFQMASVTGALLANLEFGCT